MLLGGHFREVYIQHMYVCMYVYSPAYETKVNNFETINFTRNS